MLLNILRKTRKNKTSCVTNISEYINPLVLRHRLHLINNNSIL